MQGMHASEEFKRQLENYRLTTAQIIYHMPDHPDFLQEYIWQELDLAPRFPVLKKFLHFWSHNLDGKLHSIIVASVGIIKPAEFITADALFQIQ